MVKYQGEFSFMRNGELYAVGEILVNRNNFKQGTVINIKENNNNENKETEAVNLKYEDGTEERLTVSNVSRLLLEVDPKPDINNLNESWDLS